MEIDEFKYTNIYDPMKWGRLMVRPDYVLNNFPTVPFRCVVCGQEWEVSAEQTWHAMIDTETGGIVETPKYKILDKKPDGHMPLAFPDGFVASRCWDHPDDVCRSAFVLTEWKLKPLPDPDHEGG